MARNERTWISRGNNLPNTANFNGFRLKARPLDDIKKCLFELKETLALAENAVTEKKERRLEGRNQRQAHRIEDGEVEPEKLKPQSVPASMVWCCRDVLSRTCYKYDLACLQFHKYIFDSKGQR
ncbi:hypothetical protein CPC08DRAFT_726281 [Agrocybe pediades]|nr:hypothetical protein CPC08DRAFT_726281 [Agrocybe pediades]